MAVGAVTRFVPPLTNNIAGRSQLAAGAVTVSLPEIKETSLVFLANNSAAATGAQRAVITAGTGFVITSGVGGDTGFVAWWVVI